MTTEREAEALAEDHDARCERVYTDSGFVFIDCLCAIRRAEARGAERVLTAVEAAYVKARGTTTRSDRPNWAKTLLDAARRAALADREGEA